MNLWLDDTRTPKNNWWWARTIEGAILLLEQEEVINLSLDYNLDCAVPGQQYNKNGMDLLVYMAKNRLWSKNKPTVHTACPVMKLEMESFIKMYWNTDKEYDPDIKIAII